MHGKNTAGEQAQPDADVSMVIEAADSALSRQDLRPQSEQLQQALAQLQSLQSEARDAAEPLPAPPLGSSRDDPWHQPGGDPWEADGTSQTKGKRLARSQIGPEDVPPTPDPF
eukprot:1170105-Karenia_brevis.AAC.1